MDIVVAHPSEEFFLVLGSCNKFDDGSGYMANLRMRSGGFQLETEFFFEEWSLQQFISGITDMDRTLSGKATLQPMWETDFIELEITSLGRVSVTGEFMQPGDFDQMIKFGFETDQTCLAPLRDKLRLLSEQ